MPVLTEATREQPVVDRKKSDETNDEKKHDEKVDEEEEKEPFLGLKMTQVLGGIGASSTAAVLGGQLGVAGTVAGAALTSFTIVVGGALYTRTFDRTKDGIDSAVSRLRLGGTPPVKVPKDSDYAIPDEDPTRVIAAQAEAKDEAETVLPWYHRIAPVKVLVAAAGLFLIAAVVVTGLEALRGSSVSGGDGTTIGQISRGEVSSNTRANADRDGTAEGQTRNGPAAEPTARPAPTSTTAPQTNPTTDPTTEPTTGATTAPTTEPTTGSDTDATTAPTTAPTTGSGSSSDTGTESGAGSNSGTGTGSGNTGSRTGSDTGSGSAGSTGAQSGTGTSGALTTES